MGFRHPKARLLARVINEDCVQTVTYQVSTYGSPRDAQASLVTTHLGVGFHSLNALMCEFLSFLKCDDKFPTHIWVDTGNLTYGGFGRGQFTLYGPENLDELAIDMVRQLVESALPFFERHSTIEQAEPYWAAEKGFATWGLFYRCGSAWLRGDCDRARNLLSERANALEPAVTAGKTSAIRHLDRTLRFREFLEDRSHS